MASSEFLALRMLGELALLVLLGLHQVLRGLLWCLRPVARLLGLRFFVHYRRLEAEIRDWTA